MRLLNGETRRSNARAPKAQRRCLLGKAVMMKLECCILSPRKNAGCCNKSWFPLGCSRSLHVVPVTMATRLPRGSMYRGQYPEVNCRRGIVPGSARSSFRSACSRPRPHRGTILRYGRHPTFPGFPAGPPRRSQALHPQLERARPYRGAQSRAR